HGSEIATPGPLTGSPERRMARAGGVHEVEMDGVVDLAAVAGGRGRVRGRGGAAGAAPGGPGRRRPAPGVSDGAEGRGDRAGHGDRAGGAAPGTGPVAVEPGHRSGGRRTARGLARTSASSDARNDYLWLDRRDVFRVNEGVSAGEERRGSGGDAGAERVGRGRSPKECEDEPGEERVAGAHGEASVEARRASRPNPGRVGRDGALGA